jgi:hypothetical protein
VRRRLFNLAAAVSLGLMLALVGLWVRSYWRSDAIVCFGTSRMVAAQGYAGMLIVGGDDRGYAPRHWKIDSWPVNRWL